MKNPFIRIIIARFLIFSSTFLFAQQDSLKPQEIAISNKQYTPDLQQDASIKNKTNRYGIQFLPSTSRNIYGLAVGFWGSDVVCGRHYTKTTHGVNIQILGQGLFSTFYINNCDFSNLFTQENPKDSILTNDSTWRRTVHNGILLSTFGSWTDKINGFSGSLWMSAGTKVNGVSCNLFWNLYHQINGASFALFNRTSITNGVQIGLINKTKRLRGFQFGLWNKSSKRSLPILNWGFRD